MDIVLLAVSNLVYKFNPFDEVVLDRFIENNFEHFKTHKSMIAYANDRHKKSLTKYGLRPFSETRAEKYLCIN